MVADVLARPLRWLARAATGLAVTVALLFGGTPVTAAPAPSLAEAQLPATVSTQAPAASTQRRASAPADAPADARRPQPASSAPVTTDPATGSADRDAVHRWERSATGRRGPPSGE